jgi:predicted DNA-binding transcriptional regulator YafY
MSNRLTARDRLTRLLSVIPWVAQQDDGALIEDIVTRFDYPRTQLLDDLQDVVFFVGVHPFTPDSLIEVEIGDERVHIRYADWFSRPLRLTPEEGARLLTAGRSVLPLAESDDDNGAGPLLRALTKLGTALGESAADAVDVRLGHAPSDTLAVLRDALARQRQIDIEYYAYGRDELTERRVDTNRLFSDQGNWYLSGWCHRAVGERVFRVDRIRTVAITDEPNADVGPTNASSFSPDSDDPRVVLRLAQSARWVIEQYPVEQVVENDDHIDVTMAVTAIGWLERLLLRLGPAAEILRLDPPLPADLCRHAAARVLTRYQ